MWPRGTIAAGLRVRPLPRHILTLNVNLSSPTHQGTQDLFPNWGNASASAGPQPTLGLLSRGFTRRSDGARDLGH